MQSILPVTAKKSSGRFANSNINSYNAAIAQLATELDVYYLNVAESFKDTNGNMPSKASSDGIHFGTAYYRRWIEYLKRHTVYTGKIPEESSSSSVQTSSTSSVPPVTSKADKVSSSVSIDVSSEKNDISSVNEESE